MYEAMVYDLDPFQEKIYKTLKSGKLVDDKIIVDIVKNLKENCDTFMDGEFVDSDGLILDGFPRTVGQAEMLEKIMKVDVIIHLDHRDDILIKKL